MLAIKIEVQARIESNPSKVFASNKIHFPNIFIPISNNLTTNQSPQDK